MDAILAYKLSNQTEEQQENFKSLISNLTNQLKGLTYSEAKNALEHVKIQLEHNLTLN